MAKRNPTDLLFEAAMDAGGPMQGFNGRGSSLVTSNSTPTGRTTGASSGFDMVDGVPVPEDRSVRRFDGAFTDSILGGTPFGYSMYSNLAPGPTPAGVEDRKSVV